MERIEIDYHGKKLAIESGQIAKQTDGSVMVSYGDTRVLVNVVSSKKSSDQLDFFPLTCIYQIRTYGRGKIPGGFIKRESRPSERETLVSRLIDRPLRPLFLEGYSSETQVIATVLSYDQDSNPEVAAMLGASCAINISNIPFGSILAGVNLGYFEGEYLINPSQKDQEKSELNLFMVASKKAVIMVESEAKQLDEKIMLGAIEAGQKAILPLIDIQEQLKKKMGKEKREFIAPSIDAALEKKITKSYKVELAKALNIPTKRERSDALYEVKENVLEKFVTDDSEVTSKDVNKTIHSISKSIIRDQIIKMKKRIDGRKLDEIRPIQIELGILPKAHGSALFTRGETQALVVTTLGTKDDEQMVDDISGVHFKKFYLHYNFPSYSVGEVGRMGPPGRREIGHGKLSERGLLAVLPEHQTFPYTIRIVSEIMESNGSSSMASVCGGSLSMMDSGIPLERPVAGIAMGLVSEGKSTLILSDILGDEDHVGDMDFKVVGTDLGITALQMDIKIDGLDQKILGDALSQAKKGRLHILKEMALAIGNSRESVSENAPRFIQHKIPSSKIKVLIGPGGSTIKGITAESGAKIEINDTGIVNISSSNQQSAEKALAIIRELVKEVEIGSTYLGKIKKLMDFGAFVEILPGTEGLVHISEIAEERVEDIRKVLNEGQSLKVKAIGFDKRGKLKLSARNIE